MTKKNILITGSSGEIGENLIKKFSQSKNYNIIAIDLNQTSNNKINDFFQGSIVDDKILDDINSKYDFDEIYHLAAILSTKAESEPKIAENINVQGTIKLLDLAQSQSLKRNKNIKFFFPSSIAVYNIKNKKNKNKLINEIMYCNPYTFYGKHKLFCENLGTALDHYNHNKNIKLDFRCIRFPGIISKNTIPTGGTSDYAPEMILAAKKMVPYSCFVSKESKLPFIVMPDAINAIIKLMSSSKNKLTSNVYNITSFSPSVEDFYKEISLYYKNFNLTYNINKNRQSIVNSWPGIIDDSKAKKDWDWKPNYNFKSAFRNYFYKKS